MEAISYFRFAGIRLGFFLIGFLEQGGESARGQTLGEGRLTASRAATFSVLPVLPGTDPAASAHTNVKSKNGYFSITYMTLSASNGKSN